MGFWDIFRKKKDDEAMADGPEPRMDPPHHAPAPVVSKPDPFQRQGEKDIARLGRIGMHGGPTPEEALSIFGQLRSTPDEARAVDELVRASQVRPLPESLLLALGSTLVDRGELDVAARVMAHATSSPALVLASDLYERKNDLPNVIADGARHSASTSRVPRWPRVQRSSRASPMRRSTCFARSDAEAPARCTKPSTVSSDDTSR